MVHGVTTLLTGDAMVSFVVFFISLLTLDQISFMYAECQRKYDPPNGKINCESKKYALDSKCYLVCDPGFIPYDLRVTTCLYDKKTDDFIWDIDDIRLQCVRSISLIIGGIQTNYEYTNQVEVFAPSKMIFYLRLLI